MSSGGFEKQLVYIKIVYITKKKKKKKEDPAKKKKVKKKIV